MKTDSYLKTFFYMALKTDIYAVLFALVFSFKNIIWDWCNKSLCFYMFCKCSAESSFFVCELNFSADFYLLNSATRFASSSFFSIQYTQTTLATLLGNWQSLHNFFFWVWIKNPWVGFYDEKITKRIANNFCAFK